jgi:hypothetical protein
MSGMFKRPDNSAAERQLAEQKAENARMLREAEVEKIDLAEQSAARRRAKQRGGSRMLLSEVRIAPETGIQTFGANGVERA